jgi:small subunit ribosomal protein S6
MAEYELTFVIQPDADQEQQEALRQRVVDYITDAGGELLGTLEWGRRRLAFPIRNYTAGFYVTLRIRLAPSAIDDLQRMLRLNEDVLRYLVLSAEDVPAPPLG